MIQATQVGLETPLPRLAVLKEEVILGTNIKIFEDVVEVATCRPRLTETGVAKAELPNVTRVKATPVDALQEQVVVATSLNVMVLQL